MRLNLWTIIAIAAVILGVGFEAMKHAKVRDAGDTALKQELNRMDYEPYARNTDNDPEDQPVARVAQNAEHKFPETNTIGGGNPPAAPRGVVKYEKSEADKAKEKKKKKKKKKKVETAAVQNNQLDKAEDVEEEEPEEFGVTGQEAVAPEAAPTAANPRGASVNLSYDEWAAKLLNQPDAAAVQKFIQAYQNGQVSSEVFYKIVREMIKDSREAMSTLGILAASKTPSYSSFVVLIEVLDNSSSSATSRASVETALNTYTQMSYLPILESVIRSSTSTNALLAATKRLTTSAQNAKKAWEVKQQGGTGGGSPSTVKNPYARYYSRFVDLLGRIRSTDSSVTTSAQEALATINQLMT